MKVLNEISGSLCFVKNHGVFDSHDFLWKNGLVKKAFKGNGICLNKRGQMAEGIHMMYRLLMVSLVAFIVFGAGSFVYTYYIDVRDVEARILVREVVDCLVDDGVLDLSGELLGGCDVVKSDRFYVGVDVFRDGESIKKFSEGDSGALWIRDLFGKVSGMTGNAVFSDVSNAADSIAKYEPGYYEVNYSVVVLDGGNKFDGIMKMEVLVNYGDE
ncbi:MAG: hypothetical protein V1888_01530 [archaeon]